MQSSYSVDGLKNHKIPTNMLLCT
ncbi:rCG36437 [Rattus norvegicus]|uniref:RCG36437 n=1 Tax=Rattus norvegicus TaxID=10116 RepID=A6IQC4_RAT|nr:rCG36437 [Rattus norvegicus]